MVFPMPEQPVKAMLFGKLPAHGDFVARGLAAPDRDAIDLWLGESLADARCALGPLFAERYDNAPAWRFVEEGECGLNAGAVAPSVDAVGRRFPVWLALGVVEAGQAADAARCCEDLLYDAMAGAWDADRLHAALRAAAPESVGDEDGMPRWWTLGGARFAAAEIAGHRPAALFRVALSGTEDRA